jgi:hypothetical protein
MKSKTARCALVAIALVSIAVPIHLRGYPCPQKGASNGDMLNSPCRECSCNSNTTPHSWSQWYLLSTHPPCSGKFWGDVVAEDKACGYQTVQQLLPGDGESDPVPYVVWVDWVWYSGACTNGNCDATAGTNGPAAWKNRLLSVQCPTPCD